MIMTARSDLPPFVLFLMIGAAVVALCFKLTRERSRRDGYCRFIAGRLGGTFESGGWFGESTIRFRLKDQPAVLRFQDGRQPHTHLRIGLSRDPGGTLRISRDSVAQIFISLLEGRRLRIGDALFDRTYAVRSYPESLGLRVFAPERRQEAMTAVRRLLMCSGLTIEVTSKTLDIRIDEMADDVGVALAVVRTGQDFLRFLVEPVPEPGIQWGRVVERPSGLCPVCTTELYEPMIRCGRCRVPHHSECWVYFGHCAVYGCDPQPGGHVA